MENKVVKYAPKEVIEELDNWEKPHNSVAVLLEDILYKLNGFTRETSQFVYGDSNEYSNTVGELAVAKHVFGIERLQPERETRYIVTDGGGNFYLENGSLYIDSAESNDAKDYRGQGMTKEQADALVDNFGGSAVEIPETERETRYYVEFKDNDGITTYVRASDSYPAYLTVAKPEYKVGLYHETAVKAQALYGGTIEEIK